MSPSLRPLVAAVISALVAIGVVVRGPHPHGRRPPPAIGIGGEERTEACLLCHDDVRGLGPAHDPRALGCSPCHGGDPLALDEQSAHRHMILLSGDLRTASSTCGRRGCHPTEVARVDRSVMAGAPALLGVDAFAFGERAIPEVRQGDDLRLLAQRTGPFSPAESHVRKLCASCHLGYPKDSVGDHGFDARGGGCAACHLGRPTVTRASTSGPLHPDVAAAVDETRCEGCHSRSGRIAQSYYGRVELEPSDPRVTGALPDGRPIAHVSPDVHAAAGMGCLDCHTERGVMGDGAQHQHGYQAVDVRCEDCHGSGRTEAVARADVRAPDAAARSSDVDRVVAVLRDSWRLRGGPDLGDTPLTTRAGTPLWRTDAQRRLLWRADAPGTRTGPIVIPAASDAAYHRLLGHERLSCQACHSAWAPRCRSCHTRFEDAGRQVDHLSGQQTPGAWIETAGGNGDGPPLLALGPQGRIGPFVEGMTLRIEGVGEPIERVLWAPLDPHTTAQSRACASCHRVDRVEELAPSAGETTRIGARLLDESERARITRVAACLACHPSYEDTVYVDFARSVGRLREHELQGDSDRGSGEPPSTGDPVRRCAGKVPR